MMSKKPPGQLRCWFMALKYFLHSATLYNVGDDEFHVVFDSTSVGDDLREMIDVLNTKRTRIPWRENRVIQFGIAGEGRWKSTQDG